MPVGTINQKCNWFRPPEETNELYRDPFSDVLLSSTLTKTTVDALGQSFSCNVPPTRVVSLVPSITETLFDMGVWDSVVGVTRYCVHPETATTDKTVVGGTKKINVDVIKQLNPDLVLCNQEENTPEIIHNLESAGIRCHVSFPTDIPTAVQSIVNLSLLFGKEQWAKEWTNQVQTGLQQPYVPFRYAYFIWRKPWMISGQDTFITQMLSTVGGVNVSCTEDRYPEVQISELIRTQCDAFLLSSEPFPFTKKHMLELESHGIEPNKIHFIDGEMCSWHGTRLLRGLEYLRQWRQHLPIT